MPWAAIGRSGLKLSLWGSSSRSLYKDIFEANKDVLRDPNVIKVGQKLKIP